MQHVRPSVRSTASKSGHRPSVDCTCGSSSRSPSLLSIQETSRRPCARHRHHHLHRERAGAFSPSVRPGWLPAESFFIHIAAIAGVASSSPSRPAHQRPHCSLPALAACERTGPVRPTGQLVTVRRRRAAGNCRRTVPFSSCVDCSRGYRCVRSTYLYLSILPSSLHQNITK